MPLPSARGRRAAAGSETILIVVVVAVALLLLVTLFGRRIAGIFGGGSKGLDGKAVAAGGGTQGNGSGVDGFQSGDADDPKLSKATKGNETVGAVDGALSAGKVINFDSKFTPTEKEKTLKGILALPSGLTDFAPVEVQRTKAKNAFEDSEDRILLVGSFVLDPDAKGGFNDVHEEITGVNPAFTVERVVFHETLHGFHEANRAEIEALFQPDASKPSFETVIEGIKGKQEVSDAFLGFLAIKEEIEKRAKAKGLKPRDAEGNLKPDVVAKVFEDDPSLKKDFEEAAAAVSKALADAGVPSRFPGDTHALKNTKEFFAILVEIAKFDPGRFAELQKNPKFPFPELLTFIQDHPELLR